MPSYAVIFRTHVWDEGVAEMARRAMACAPGGTFAVAADETAGVLDCGGFAKIAHTDDVSSLGLPSEPRGKVLWWNADYVLYAARQALPGRDYYVMLEYDVLLNADLDLMIAQCAENRVGFVAQDVRRIGPGDHWSYTSVSQMGVDLWWGLIPFVIVSARVVDVMLQARRLMAKALVAGDVTHWPYCESFMPSAAALVPGTQIWPVGRLTDARLLRFRPLLRLQDPQLRRRGIIAHPVMRGVQYIRKFIEDNPDGGHCMMDGRLRAELQDEEKQDLQMALGDQAGLRRLADGSWCVGAAEPEVIRPWEELSFAKPAIQSSHSEWSRGATAAADAALAVADPMPEDFAFHTALEADPWWQVDLTERCAIERIEIINRPVHSHKFTRFRIDLSDQGEDWVTCFAKMDNRQVSGDPAFPATVTLRHQVQARFVRIVQIGHDVMHLRRVRVLGFRLAGAPAAAARMDLAAARLVDERVSPERLGPLVERIVHERVLGRGFDSYDLDRLAFLAAGIESSQYVVARMAAARRFADAGALHDYAVDCAPATGMVLEFGVFSGRSINRIAGRMPGRVVYGFDSFEGLPETWRPGFEQGAFRRVDLPAVVENVELVVGWFDDTLPGFAAAHADEALALLHVDCDLYSSTKTIFAALARHIVPGTVIIFDEYFNYPEWRLHEYKAFAELTHERGIDYEYIGLVPSHQQVAVRVTRVG